MRTFEGPLVAYIKVLTEDRAALEAQRASRRERYNSSVEGLVAGWREASGYKLGPMMNDQALRRQFSCMVAVVVERQLRELVQAILPPVQAIERSLHHLVIYASPSGNGPERYAPKPRGTFPQQIKV